MGRKEFELSTFGGELVIAAVVFSMLLTFSPALGAALAALWIASVGARWANQPKMEAIPIRVSDRTRSKRRTRDY